MQGAILSRDLVHLSPQGYKMVGDCVRRAVAWTSQNVGFPEEEGRGSIPSEILFSTWVKAFRTSCGYDFPALMCGAKQTRSTNDGPRPTKQRRWFLSHKYYVSPPTLPDADKTGLT